MADYVKDVLVETDWVAQHLDDDSIRIVEVDENRDPRESAGGDAGDRRPYSEIRLPDAPLVSSLTVEV